MNLTLTPAKSKKNYYKIYVGDEFLGCLPQKLIPAEYFLQNSSLLDPSLEAFILSVQSLVLKSASDTLLNYLAKMERTIYDCQIYLKRKDFPEKVINQVIKDALDKKWLSDERYAELYTEEAILMGRSTLDVKYKLKQKKIRTQIIDKIVDKIFNPAVQREVISELIDRLIEKHSDTPPHKRYEKIATALYRKGFQYQDYEEILKAKMSENQ